MHPLRLGFLGVMYALVTGSSLAQEPCLHTKLFEPSGGYAFGYAVALSGDRAACSWWDAKYNATKGGVRVFDRIDGIWKQTAFVFPAQPEIAGGFGAAVALQGSRMLVGARSAVTPFGKKGAVYEFVHDGQVWQETGSFYSGEVSDWPGFGWAIALDGDRAVVSRFNYDHGDAWVFERSPGGEWVQQAKLDPVGAGGGDQFGRDVALAGDVAVVGAQHGTFGGSATGAAYVFERKPGGQWLQTAKLGPSDPSAPASFGRAVAVVDGDILVGASNAKSGTAYTGAVYVFRLQRIGWIETQKLVPKEAKNADAFGRSIAVENGWAIVGSIGAKDYGPGAGAAYLYGRDATGRWGQAARFTPKDLEPYDNFGESVAISGQLSVIGMWSQAADPPWPPGAAYVYAVGPDLNGNGLMDPCECPGDIYKDWTVGQKDLALLLAYWGKCAGQPGFKPEYDLDQSGCIDQGDLGILLQNYGKICP